MKGRSMILSPEKISELRSRAEAAAKASYSPYSTFAVGAAVLTASDKIFSGCNVENASYGLTNCAERTAIFSAVAAGERIITAVAIHTSTAHGTAPCGACRQVIFEFGPEASVYSFSHAAEPSVIRITDLLPYAFGPSNLRD